jgi:hypothetical protein
MTQERKMQPTIYISGPYGNGDSATPEQVEVNIQQAINVSNCLLDAGFLVVCPHLSHYQHKLQERPWSWWLAYDLTWLLKCQVVYRMPGESKGADMEVQFANLHNIPVFYQVADITNFLNWSSLCQSQ